MDIVSLEDLKQAAKEKIPSDLWDFIEGAAFDEITKQRNEEKRVFTINKYLIPVQRVPSCYVCISAKQKRNKHIKSQGNLLSLSKIRK